MSAADEYEKKLAAWKKRVGINESRPVRQTIAKRPEAVIDMEDDDHEDDSAICQECGGEGHLEYNDAGPSYWGEDCPSEVNHLVRCQSCSGTGRTL